MRKESIFKPYSILFPKILIQYMIGIAIILILASFIKPPEVTPTYDPFHIFAITERIYDNVILVATMAAERVVDLAIIAITLMMGEFGFWAMGKLGPYALALIQIIVEKKEETSADTHEKRSE